MNEPTQHVARYLLLAGPCLLLALIQCQPGLAPPPTGTATCPRTPTHTPISTIPLTVTYDSPALIWPFEAGHTWQVNNGYNVPGHEDAARYALDLVRVDGQTRGQPVLAVADGIVWLKKTSIGGLVIRLKKSGVPTNYYAEYLHMAGIRLSAGDAVSQGQKIGEVSDVGYADMPHLHFFVARYEGRDPPLQSNTWVIPLEGDSPNWELWNHPVPLVACGRPLDPPLDNNGKEMENGWLNEVIHPCSP